MALIATYSAVKGLLHSNMERPASAPAFDDNGNHHQLPSVIILLYNLNVLLLQLT